MKKTVLVGVVLILCLIGLEPVMAQERDPSSRPPRWRLYGDWQLKVEFGERQMDAILTFSRDQERNLTAQF